MTSAELDELTRAYADRYVGLLYSACDALKQDNPDALQRREAQTLLVDGSSNTYDIATNADAFTRLLDLVVVTRLLNQVWVEEGLAERTFGERAAHLTSALEHSRTEVEALSARVLTVEQKDTIETLLAEWRAENPGMVRASFVRFSNFAVGRGRTAASEVLAAGGLFGQVAKAGQAVDEARLLGERMFYQLKREPTLLRWQAAAAKDDLVATPEVATALADVHRLTNQAEQLPAHFAAEREAILAAVDSRMASVNSTAVNIKDVVAEAKSLVASMEPTARAFDQLLKTADTILARFDAWNRWTFEHDPKPFDIREYTEMIKTSAATSQRLTELVKPSNDMLASPEWAARIDEVNHAADGRIETLALNSRSLVDDFFRRLYIAFGVLFLLLVCYRAISIVLARRLAAPRPWPGSPPSSAGSR